MRRHPMVPSYVGLAKWASDAHVSTDGKRVAWTETVPDAERDEPVSAILVAPTAGRVRVLGEDDPARVRDRIGFLPEERGLYRRMSPVRAIGFLASQFGLRIGLTTLSVLALIAAAVAYRKRNL